MHLVDRHILRFAFFELALRCVIRCDVNNPHLTRVTEAGSVDTSDNNRIEHKVVGQMLKRGA